MPMLTPEEIVALMAQKQKLDDERCCSPDKGYEETLEAIAEIDKQLLDALPHLLELARAGEWIPVERELPPRGRNVDMIVLVVWPDCGRRAQFRTQGEHGEKEWFYPSVGCYGDRVQTATHWKYRAELPPLPLLADEAPDGGAL